MACATEAKEMSPKEPTIRLSSMLTLMEISAWNAAGRATMKRVR